VSETSTSVPAEGIDVAVLGRCARREREEKEGSFLFEKLEDGERVSVDRRGETRRSKRVREARGVEGALTVDSGPGREQWIMTLRGNRLVEAFWKFL
jgi:hypothetical protein